MHSESEKQEFIRKGNEILHPCRPKFVDFLYCLESKLGEVVFYGDSEISLKLASFSVLKAIAMDRLEEDEQVRGFLHFFDEKEFELRDLLLNYDGDGRYMSLNHMDEDFNSDIQIYSNYSTQLFVQYRYADLQWLIRAFNGIVKPSRFSHKPYNKKLYMIMNIKDVCSIYNSHKLKFTMVDSWDDPYENVFLRKILPMVKGPRLFGNVSRRVYGECWSTKEKSDAMWRIYSKDLDKAGKQFHSVQLCTTVDKLISLISQTSHPLSAFGHIMYDDEANTLFLNLKKKCNYLLTQPYPPISALAMESLYYKRNCFDHEREYRITIWIDDSNRPSLRSLGIIEDWGTVTDKFLNVPINSPNDFFESIVLDPRLVNKSSLEASFKSELLSVGVDPSLISRSDLYEPPIV